MPAKTLAAQWKRFMKFIPSEMRDNPDELDRVKVVFYSGAIALFELFSKVGKDATLVDSIVAVQLLEKEILDYMDAETAKTEKEEAAKDKAESDIAALRAMMLPKSSLN